MAIKMPTKTLSATCENKKIIILIGQRGSNKKNYFQHNLLPKMAVSLVVTLVAAEAEAPR